VNSVGDSTGGLTPEITLRLFAPDDGKYTERAVGTPGVPLRLTEPVRVDLDPAVLLPRR